MATLLPPPKRQKVYHGVPEPELEAPKPTSNVIVHFVSEDDGRSLAPAVSLPANVSREGLEALVNKLSTQVCSFFFFLDCQPFSVNFFLLFFCYHYILLELISFI
jgi:NLE (NUC135) domain-containing protein